MAIPDISKILSRLDEWFKHEGIIARVFVKGKDTLEVRLESRDLFAEEFELTPQRPVVRTHVSSKDFKTIPKSKPKKTLKIGGFNIKPVQHKDGMPESELKRLHGFTEKYSFLSATRLDSKVWETTCREVVWLAYGFFADSHQWDKRWCTKTEEKGGGPSIVRGKFKDISSVLDAIEQCLDYVEEAHKNGGYWYPVLERGRIPRKTLASFLCTSTKSGTEWSPFCEVLWEMSKDVAIKSALPKSAVSVAEQTVKESQYLSGMPASSMASYWNGVKKFVDWYYAHRDELMSRVDNRVRLADISMAVTLVKEWNASASGRALPLTYVYPGNDKWFRFVQWCKTYRNVVIPDYRKAG